MCGKHTYAIILIGIEFFHPHTTRATYLNNDDEDDHGDEDGDEHVDEEFFENFCSNTKQVAGTYFFVISLFCKVIKCCIYFRFCDVMSSNSQKAHWKFLILRISV